MPINHLAGRGVDAVPQPAGAVRLALLGQGKRDLATGGCALISFHSTMKSNFPVGMPLDIMVYRKDSFSVSSRYRRDDNDDHFKTVRALWNEGIRELVHRLSPVLQKDGDIPVRVEVKDLQGDPVVRATITMYVSNRKAG